MKATTSCSAVSVKRKRARKQSKIEKSLTIVMDKFVASQRHAEEKYLELKEKRMKMMKEVENQRIRMEENRREADRQHEMQLWMMMT